MTAISKKKERRKNRSKTSEPRELIWPWV